MHAEVLNLEERREQARIKLDSYHRQLRKAFNKKVIGRSFQEGDLVFKEVTQATKEKGVGKLLANWEGLYIIHKVAINRAYYLKSADGELLPKLQNVNNDVFGSPRPNEYVTENRQGIPLITGRFDSLAQLDEFSRSF
ncbi:hypothetical protein IFM89_034715 [Coptis chinensis]|uniref:Photosystem II cytochrome b559 alpha subunit lumenal region domain-containing protein n=1 Tax=Coptis chinensis TaxID=261450 RepID=A0A835HAI3_9MAGN|nr:hypothetical protein IFM89_034715 [Coptis chinensis]